MPRHVPRTLSMPEGELKDVEFQSNLMTNAETPTAAGARPNGRTGPARTKESCLVQFDLDLKHPTEVGDEATICLNLIAADLKRSQGTALALIGNSGMRDAMGRQVGTRVADASQRARNSRDI